MKIHRARVVGTFVTLTGSTTNLTGSFRGSFEGDEKLATTGSNTFNGNQTVNGNMTVTGRIVAEEFHTEFISSSIIYKSGSTKFGDSLDDNHGFTGSLSISGSLNINGTSYSAATSGTSGVNGSSGATGSSGSAGTSGINGTNGTSGVNGTNGADGSSGATGSSGSAGTSGSSGISVGNAYLHTQSSSSSTWTINHNLNYKYLSVTVYDSSDNIMLPESIIANSANQLTISFGVNESGYAMLSYGASSSGTSGASGVSGTSGSSGSSGTSAGSASRNVTTFIATSGQTTFTISGGYTVGLVDVFVNGVRYSPTDFTATNGTTVVLGVSSDVDDVVDIVTYVSSMTAIAGEGTTSTIPKYTASGTIGNSIITDNGTNATVNGSLTVTGNLTAQQFIVSSSVTHLTTSFSSGSTKFGDSLDDNHNFTGSLIVSGSANPLKVGSNLLFVSSSGNVGIGTVSPSAALHINGAALPMVVASTSATELYCEYRYNTSTVVGYIGNGAGIVASSGSSTDFGIRAQSNLIFTSSGGTERMRITSGGNVLIGTSTLGAATGTTDLLTIGKSGSSSTGINFTDGTSTRWGFIYISNAKTVYGSFTDIAFESGASATERMRITSAGAINILGSYFLANSGTGYRFNNQADTFNNFIISDNGNASLRGALTQNASDERLKNNIKIIPNAIDKIKQLRGVSFEWNQELYETSRTTDIGVIAQDIQKVLPDAVSLAPFDTSFNDYTSKSGKNYLTVYYEKIIPLLIEGIKEQETKIQELSAELTSAKQEIELLKLK